MKAQVSSHSSDQLISRIVSAYDDGWIRLYCRVRFGILRQRFLAEIGQYLPPDGVVLDVGCGFGLFSLYYAAIEPRRVLRGVDISGHRISVARRAAARLRLANVVYQQADARDIGTDERFAGIYMLDIIHHIPPESVPSLLRTLRQCLEPGARLLLKDVDTRPPFKRWFTWWLDRIMAPRSPVNYWSAERLTRVLETSGFAVFRHSMVDFLPYPHVLYICEAA